MTPTPAARYYRFGTYLVDAKRRRLWRNREIVPLTAKTFDLLLFLVRRANRVLDKAEFFTALWPDTAVVEANLVRQVSLLRKALGQRADSHDYIVTIPGRGYEFVADVEELQTPPPGWAEEEPPPSVGVLDGQTDLTSAATVGGVMTRGPDYDRRWQFPMLAAMVAIVGAAVAAVLWTLSKPQVASPTGERILKQVTFEEGSPREPSWSPDGRQLVFTSEKSGNADLWVQTLDEPRARQLTVDAAHDTTPDWSPDGRWIAFRSERGGGGIFRISSDGTREERMSTFGFHPQWSPSGDQILFSGPTVRTGPRRFYVVESAGGEPREVAVNVVSRFTSSGSTKLGWLNSVAAGWHPDGRRVSFWGRAATGRWEFLTTDLSSGASVLSDISEAAQEKLRHDLVFRRFVWHPEGRYLYFEAGAENATNIWRVPINSATLAWRSLPERLTTSASEEADLAIAPDGRSIALTIRTPRTRLWAIEFDGRTGRVVGPGDALTSGRAGEIDADAARDGSKIAYRAVRGQRSEVWELDTTNRQERLLLASVGWRPSLPRWSSDGRYVAYTRAHSPTSDPQVSRAISVLSPSEGRERLLTLPRGADMTPTDWLEDGSTILGYCQPDPKQPTSVCSIRADAKSTSEPTLRTIASDPA
jgi:Tol biopolymer transport system component/DNA-binding winged helix-turn-helix (wHTH) protein